MAFDVPTWSDWVDWPAGEDLVGVSYVLDDDGNGLPTYYLLAFQVEDANGSVSTELDYATQVANVYPDDSASPLMSIRERFLGTETASGTSFQAASDIAGSQELAFEWIGSGHQYGGTIEGYRWGWDVADPNDDNDPGWAVVFGDAPEHMATAPRTFSSGIHTLTVECRDTAHSLTRMTWVLSVVPVPELADRLPLLLVDDVHDRMSGGWPDATGTARDEDAHRDDFWDEILGAVDGWDGARDVIDTQEDMGWGYREAVMYRSIVWSTRGGANNYVSNNFADTGWSDRYVWLEPFMESVGNLFLVGQRAADQFEPTGQNDLPWIYPVVYDCEDWSSMCGSQQHALSEGSLVDPDGTVRVLGRETFPYRSLGLAVTDRMAAPTFWLSPGFCGNNVQNRRNRCAGTKAVLLDEDFTADHGWAFGMEDTVFTWDVVDHMDDIDDLGLNWVFGGDDEFYNVNVTARITDWTPQSMPDGSPTNIPMWRAYTRYDWILDSQHAAGNADWPGAIDVDAQEYCGDWTVRDATGRTHMDGVALGVLNMKYVDTKPTGRPDVLWGFDPHRFDHAAMTDAIRRVLAGNFGLSVQDVVANEGGQEGEHPLPSVTRLHRCRPNPFNPATVVSFDMARPGRAKVSVHDVRGRLIAVLEDGEMGAGTHDLTWRGLSDDGRVQAAGTYFIRLETEDGSQVRRATLLK